MQSLDYNKSSFGVLASNFEEGIRSRAVSSVGGGERMFCWHLASGHVESGGSLAIITS